VGYVSKHLSGDETIVHTARLHWAVFLSTLLVGLLTVLIFGGSIVMGTGAGGTVGESLPFGALLAGLPALMFVASLVNAAAVWISTEMAVTNRRVIGKTGLISRTSVDLRLRKLESVQLEQSIVGRILGYGTVVFIGSGGSENRFAFVADPEGTRAQVTDAVEAAETAASV
jgi:uncharacterized membrane protein YdbT with pleckstrin-like domain